MAACRQVIEDTYGGRHPSGRSSNSARYCQLPSTFYCIIVYIRKITQWAASLMRPSLSLTLQPSSGTGEISLSTTAMSCSRVSFRQRERGTTLIVSFTGLKPFHTASERTIPQPGGPKICRHTSSLFPKQTTECLPILIPIQGRNVPCVLSITREILLGSSNVRQDESF